jgi:pSer/pThr/pTyr-binding forkhead associated (FHA) protein
MVTCQFCGSENEAWYAFCQNCGKMIAVKKPSSPALESPAGVGLASNIKISSRPTEINEALLQDLLPEQSTMALQEPVMAKEIATSAVSLPAYPPPSMAPPAQDRRSAEMPAAGTLVECPGCHKRIPSAHALCGFCGIRLSGTAGPADPLPAESLPPDSAAGQSGTPFAMLMRVREDGSFDCGLRLREGEILLGREAGDLSFPSDSLMSKQHARVLAEGGQIYLEDLGSTNGTFLRLKSKKQLHSGDYLLIGKQLLRFEMDAPGTAVSAASASQTLVLGSLIGNYEARLVKRLPNGKDSNEYPLTESVTTIGREKGEILFKNDPFVSGRHARVQLESGCYTVEDLNSSNGTYLRLCQREEIGHGDFFIVGEQLFQVRLSGR